MRVIVLGLLGVLLVLGLFDFQAKQSATSTADGWRTALRAKGEDNELTKSEFDKLPIHGKPTMTSEAAGSNSFAAKSLNTYTWTGIIRSYVVKVYLGLGNDPTIETVTGPGAETPE